MELAPIALFAYNRPRHLQLAVESLRKNSLARESELFIFSDGPKGLSAADKVKEVRAYLGSIKGFKEIRITQREANLGLARSVILGVTEVVRKYGKIIVLEDDLVVSPYFLKFMNEGLSLYENEEKVASICGYMYPIKIQKDEVVFFRIPDCWGWATWRRGWDLFEPDGNRLFGQLREKRMYRQFNLGGAYNFSRMLRKQAQGRIDSWAIRWYASTFLNNRLSLYPAKSLVNNTGFDLSGSNCGLMPGYKTRICEGPILVNKLPVEESKTVIQKVGLFFRLKRMNIARPIVNRALALIKKNVK